MKNVSEIHRFSDFATDFIGPKIRMADVINREIVLTGFKVLGSSKVPEYESGDLTIYQIEVDGKQYVLFSASKVLRSQANEYHDKLPFRTTITKHKDFYTFT